MMIINVADGDNGNDGKDRGNDCCGNDCCGDDDGDFNIGDDSGGDVTVEVVMVMMMM